MGEVGRQGQAGTDAPVSQETERWVATLDPMIQHVILAEFTEMLREYTCGESELPPDWVDDYHVLAEAMLSFVLKVAVLGPVR